jgi:hypothetical protein
MIDSLPTSFLHCWSNTGSGDLLPKSGNAPTSSDLLQQKLVYSANVSGRSSTLDAQNHRTSQTMPSEHTSNPHSSVKTNRKHLLPPRGFLP